MCELVLTEVDESVLHGLRDRAIRHGRTSAEEAKTILADALRGRTEGSWVAVDAIYERLAATGRSFTDSAELLREDRDR
jgi:plasmid stability protein